MRLDDAVVAYRVSAFDHFLDVSLEDRGIHERRDLRHRRQNELLERVEDQSVVLGGLVRRLLLEEVGNALDPWIEKKKIQKRKKEKKEEAASFTFQDFRHRRILDWILIDSEDGECGEEAEGHRQLGDEIPVQK